MMLVWTVRPAGMLIVPLTTLKGSLASTTGFAPFIVDVVKAVVDTLVADRAPGVVTLPAVRAPAVVILPAVRAPDTVALPDVNKEPALTSLLTLNLQKHLDFLHL